MTFFPEINTEKTKANAKRKLREYPRWRRVANDVDGQKVTATYTFEPRQANGNPSRPVERLAINRIDADAEIKALEKEKETAQEEPTFSQNLPYEEGVTDGQSEVLGEAESPEDGSGDGPGRANRKATRRNTQAGK
ncbi:ArpU family phage packaging/lysis transcriptional regulator [Streptococcus suis]